jgi:hypothetical protein
MIVMKCNIYSLLFAIAVAAPIGLPPNRAIAQSPAPISRISSPSLQRVYQDLVRSGSDDFFRQGKEQFEREIRQVNKPQPTEDLLKINGNLQPQQDKIFGEPEKQQRRSR